MKKKEKKRIAPNEASLLRWIAAAVIGFIIGLAIALAIEGFLRSLPGSIMGVAFEPLYTMCQFVCYFIGFVIALKLVAKTSLKDFVLGVGGKINVKECLLILGLYIIGFLVLILQGLDAVHLRGVKAGEFAFLFVFMLLTAWTQTTWEELIFRGILLRWACKNQIGFTKKSVIVVVLTTVAFALGHVTNPEVTSQSGFDVVLAISAYAIPGVVFAVANLYFGSLMPGIIIHWINNFVSFTLLGTDSGAMPLPTLLVSDGGNSVSVASMFVGTLIPYSPIIVYILWDVWKKKKAASVG